MTRGATIKAPASAVTVNYERSGRLRGGGKRGTDAPEGRNLLERHASHRSERNLESGSRLDLNITEGKQSEAIKQCRHERKRKIALINNVAAIEVISKLLRRLARDKRNIRASDFRNISVRISRRVLAPPAAATRNLAAVMTAVIRKWNFRGCVIANIYLEWKKCDPTECLGRVISHPIVASIRNDHGRLTALRITAFTRKSG